jgi:hypothetical protein
MKTTKIDNGLFYIALCLMLFIALLCSCTKRDIQPQQVILWENSTADSVTIFINGTKDAVGLKPHETWVRGDASWLEHTYSIVGGQQGLKVQMRNTITSVE